MGVGQNMLFELAEFHLAALVPGIMLSHCHGLLGHLNATETCYQPHLYFPYNDKRNPAVEKKASDCSNEANLFYCCVQSCSVTCGFPAMVEMSALKQADCGFW